MTTHPEISLRGFFRPQSILRRPPSTSLHVVWNRLRRVYRRTSDGSVATVDELMGPSSSALFDIRLSRVLDLNTQIRRSLSSLNFDPSVCDYLSLKITSFAINFAPSLSRRSYSSSIIFAHVNFIEQLSDDYSLPSLPSNPPRQSPFTYVADETFILGSSAEARGGAVENGNEGISDSAVEKLRRRKFRRREGQAESCSICQETFSDGEETIPLPCDHIYHGSCIITWLKRHRTCPLCRQQISITM